MLKKTKTKNQKLKKKRNAQLITNLQGRCREPN